MLGWFGQMSVRERAALFGWASAFIAVAALPFGYWRASQECLYSPDDVSRCDSSRAIAYAARDDIILPTGGAFFFIPYGVWAVRLGYRLGFGKTPAITKARPVFGEIGWSVGAAVLVLIALPFWITSTFGVASLGDPANSVTVKNETGEGIVFYQYRGERAYPERIDAGQAKTSHWLE